MPMVRKIPKRGFHNKFALEVAAINVGDLEANFEAGEAVTPETLKQKGLIKFRYDVLKILGSGDLTKPLTIAAHRLSTSAKAKIEKAGGTIEILPGRRPVVRNKQRKKVEKK